MRWINFFHAYQPAGWDQQIVRRVINESYAPFFLWLTKHPDIRVTVNIAATLCDHLTQLQETDLIRTIQTLQSRGQIELSTSVMYHPIVPLIPDVIASTLLARNTAVLQRTFGGDFKPAGVFLPEMAAAPHTLSVLGQAQCQWTILDEIALRGTLGSSSLSTSYIYAQSPTQMLFRNRVLSDYLLFHADLASPADFWNTAAMDGRSSDLMITAMDLENLGHHRPGLDTYWQRLAIAEDVETILVSEFLAEETPKPLTPLSASWSSREDELQRSAPFWLWSEPSHPIHQTLWTLANMLCEHITILDPNDPLWEHVGPALSSDTWWWASASPWWDATIVRHGAAKLRDAITTVAPSPAIRSQAVELAKEAAVLAAEWESSGKALAKRTAYLASDSQSSIRRMGGSVITSNN